MNTWQEAELTKSITFSKNSNEDYKEENFANYWPVYKYYYVYNVYYLH